MQAKRDIWHQGKSVSVRLEAHIWKAFDKACDARKLTKGQAAAEAQREHNGSLGDAIAAWVLKQGTGVELYDACSLWLGALVDQVRPHFEAKGYPLPARITAKLGFPSTGWKGKAIGDYWGPHCHTGFHPETHVSDDGLHTIFVHPCESNPARIMSTLVHELCHAADNLRNDHARSAKGQPYAPVKSANGKNFKTIGEAMDLEGKAKCMAFPEASRGGVPAYARAALEAAGRMPHNALNWAVKKEKTDTNRHLKFEHEGCELAVEGKAPVWRMAKTTAGHLAQVACPCCGERILNPYFEGGDDEAETVESEPEEGEEMLTPKDHPLHEAEKAAVRRGRRKPLHSMADRVAFAEDRPLNKHKLRHSMDEPGRLVKDDEGDFPEGWTAGPDERPGVPKPDSIRKRGRKVTK